ncbi:GNAT family N-acetyltransferase [Aeromicrobium tamlense]|uniref:GNAT family N-acetyltransferase n=1 Tax=Aeromicrobium tamlense TaxID=375541 RepID=A0A8I0KK81_9ACTN|nr:MULTISPECIES: GNAT family N-acetyltransferase [Aeromicrobium]MBD1272242.1 GNAT family N-acetyltransferase [Aeromicrobium tamlense]NYI38562.1 tRNA (guanine37-N1)-methyltransferase [Aeromicrobium tamlense]
MTVRPATEADLPALADLAARTFPLACPPDMPEASMTAFVAEHLSLERFAQYLAHEVAEVLVAEDDGVLTGYTLTFAREPYDDHLASLVRLRPTVELSKCYADPTAHGTGVAARLMEAVVESARAAGAASVWLGVNGRNARAQRFYAKQGFEVVGERRFVVGAHTEDDLVLERQLA